MPQLWERTQTRLGRNRLLTGQGLDHTILTSNPKSSHEKY